MRFLPKVILVSIIVVLLPLSIWDVARTDLLHSLRSEQVVLPANIAEWDALDLVAQQRMADWAFWMVVLTAVSAAATITSIVVAGVLAVRQLRQGREANIIQSRAYLHGNGIRYISHHDPDGRIFWRIWVDWVNVGSTPAKNVNLLIRIGKMSVVDGPAGLVGPRARRGLVIRPQGVISNGPFDIWPEQIYESIETGDLITVVGYATYDDVFAGTEMHETLFRSTLIGYSGDLESTYHAIDNPVFMAFNEDFESNIST